MRRSWSLLILVASAWMATLSPCAKLQAADSTQRSRLSPSTLLPAKPTPVKLTRGPYLQCGTTNSIVVRWRTETPSVSWVYYGPQPSRPEFVAAGPGLTTEHVVLLPDLKPNSQYYYFLSCGTNHYFTTSATNSYFVTAPTSSTPRPIRVWVIGDAGTRRLGQLWVRDAYYKFTGSRHTDLWLMLGDNAYDSGRDLEFQESVFDIYGEMLRKSVCWPTFGNHEGYSSSSLTQSGPYYDMFTLPTEGQAGGVMTGTEAYYSFEYGNVHFVCLNSFDIDRSPNGRMLTWLKNDLAANRSDWTVAYWHHPPYSKGEHDSDKEIGGDTRLGEMRTNALPILEAGGVDLVLCGHSHSYERSCLLDGYYGLSTNLTATMKKDAGNGKVDGTGAYRKPSGNPTAHEGTIYAVVGCSGHLSWGPLKHPAMVYSSLSLGSLVLDIEGSRFNATFLDDRGVKLDYFTITKGGHRAGNKPN